ARDDVILNPLDQGRAAANTLATPDAWTTPEPTQDPPSPEAQAKVESVAADTAADEAPLSFEAGGVRFTLWLAAQDPQDSLVLCWKTESLVQEQRLYAFKDFDIEGAALDSDLPDALNGIDSMTVLGGSLDGAQMPAVRTGSASFSLLNADDTATLSLTMAVYAPVAEPRGALALPSWLDEIMKLDTGNGQVLESVNSDEPSASVAGSASLDGDVSLDGDAVDGAMSADAEGTSLQELVEPLLERIYMVLAAGENEAQVWSILEEISALDAQDALKNNRLLLDENGAASPSFVEAFWSYWSGVDLSDRFWSTHTYAQATLELAEKQGLVEPVDEVTVRFTLDLTQPMAHAALESAAFVDPKSPYDIAFGAFEMNPMELFMEFDIASSERQSSAPRTGELYRAYEVSLDQQGTLLLDQAFDATKTISEMYEGTADGRVLVTFVYGYDLCDPRLTSLPDTLWLVPRSVTFYDRPGTLLPDQAIQLNLVPIDETKGGQT
ncbi:MAG: hypothetical protein IJ048_03190, partial [Clostridia bacterium]|nr:hypothetical protein [Clostridia bacterium]